MCQNFTGVIRVVKCLYCGKDTVNSKFCNHKCYRRLIGAWNKGLTAKTDSRVEKLCGPNPKKGLIGEDNGFFGKHHTEETKNKQRCTIKQKYENGYKNPKKGIHTGKPAHNSGKTKENYNSLRIVSEKCKIKRALQKNVYSTSIEIKLHNFLNQLNVPFIKHKVMPIEHLYQCDIFIPSKNLVIEADGVYWHKYPNGLKIDHIRTQELKDASYNVIRIWEHEIRKMDLRQFKNLLDIVPARGELQS